MTTIRINDFKGKIALITGGSSGIGRAAARMLAEQGAHVWVLARRTGLLDEAVEFLEAVRQSPEQKFGCVSADVTDPEKVNRALAQIKEDIGVPDLVINSAGSAQPGYFQETSLGIFHEMMDLNFYGTVHVIQALLPDLMARRSGYIVNISSMAGVLGVFGYTAYGASKFAVRGFTEVLRQEMKKYQVGVSIVFPPDTDTPGFAHENLSKPPETRALENGSGIMTAEAVAAVILNGVKHGQYIILPGMESKLIYRLSGVLGEAVNPILDGIVTKAQQTQNATR